MTAKRNFYDGSKPPEIETIIASYQESGLRQIILRCDRLKLIVTKPSIEETDRGRISGKDF